MRYNYVCIWYKFTCKYHSIVRPPYSCTGDSQCKEMSLVLSADNWVGKQSKI